MKIASRQPAAYNSRMDENPYKAPQSFDDSEQRDPDPLAADLAFAAKLATGFFIAFTVTAMGLSFLGDSGVSILGGTMAGAATVVVLVRLTIRQEARP